MLWNVQVTTHCARFAMCVMRVTWPVTGTYELYQLQAKCASEVPSACLLANPKNVISLASCVLNK